MLVDGIRAPLRDNASPIRQAKSCPMIRILRIALRAVMLHDRGAYATPVAELRNSLRGFCSALAFFRSASVGAVLESFFRCNRW